MASQAVGCQALELVLIIKILLARMIHEDSSRKRADAKRDGHSEA